MFVFTLDKKTVFSKKVIAVISAAVLSIAAVLAVTVSCTQGYTVCLNGMQIDTRVYGKDDIERIAVQLGYHIESGSINEENIIIPLNFNFVYENYDLLQKSIGLSLSEHKGHNAVKYTAVIAGDNKNNETILTILVCDSQFIGGDVCTRDFYGSMLPLVQQGKD